MNEPTRITEQIKQAFEGPAWHGPSVSEILAGVDAVTAAANPIPNAHSIWEIVLHLISTQKVVLGRIQGDINELRELSPEEDWPLVRDPSKAAWQDTLNTFTQNDQAMREAVSRFPEARLDQPLVPGGSTAYNNFHGYIQHTLYHLAQIGMLKKIART